MIYWVKKDPFSIDLDSPNPASKKPLDWEESAVDSLSLVEGFAENPQDRIEQLWLKLVLFLVFFLMAGRLIYLQGFKGEYYRNFAEHNRLRKQLILAPRGVIKDRQGEVLAKSAPSLNLVFVPYDLPKSDWKAQLMKLSEILAIDIGTAEKKMLNVNSASVEPVIIKQDISLEESVLFETRASDFLGFSVQKIPVRDYSAQPEAYFHVLGYAGLVSAEDLQVLDKNLYSNFDFVGKAGIEQMYENYLHGINGSSQVEVDAKGRVLAELGTQNPQSGNTLILNLDKPLQELLYNRLQSASGKRRAAAIAINPKTGEVLALVSLPSLNGAKFMRGFLPEEYEKILKNPARPLFNRSIAGVYPPGSTIKPVVATAALEEGVIDENTKYNDQGVLIIPHRYDPSVDYSFYGWKREGLGLVDVRQAIAKSSDIFFYIVSGGYPKADLPGLGIDRLAAYFRKFNLGRSLGIDLPGEQKGLVPDPEWKKNYFKDDPILSRWYLGDTYHVGIGQGDLLATPLQVAFWTATIANRGVGMQPQILKKVLKGDDSQEVLFEQRPQVLADRFIDLKHIRAVSEGMRETVVSGSAKSLNTLPIAAAGKTGTSQFDSSDPKRTHAWFTAYAPYEDPKIAITVLVEAGGEGSGVAVPVVGEALKWWAENRYNQ